MKSFHDHETAGHSDKIGTYNAVQQHYWWPELSTFIKNLLRYDMAELQETDRGAECKLWKLQDGIGVFHYIG